MNSRTIWGIQLRGKIAAFVKKNGPVKRVEILQDCGQEAEGQLGRMVESGELIRAKRGIYEIGEVRAEFKV